MTYLNSGRRCGNSVRQCDRLVQDIFTTGLAVVKDHAGDDKYLMHMLLKRLYYEHDLEPTVDRKNMMVYFPATSYIAEGKGEENYQKALLDKRKK